MGKEGIWNQAGEGEGLTRSPRWRWPCIDYPEVGFCKAAKALEVGLTKTSLQLENGDNARYVGCKVLGFLTRLATFGGVRSLKRAEVRYASERFPPTFTLRSPAPASRSRSV